MISTGDRKESPLLPAPISQARDGGGCSSLCSLEYYLRLEAGYYYNYVLLEHLGAHLDQSPIVLGTVQKSEQEDSP